MNISEARYCAGVNWCFFQIRIGQEVAVFRLHMEENKCWKLMERLGDIGERLKPLEKSQFTFRWGSEIHGNSLLSGNGKGKKLKTIPEEWQWLEDTLSSPRCYSEWFTTWCYYHGVRIFRIE